MWAHYTARHVGFLIGFDADTRILTRPTPIFHHFGPVSYCHHRPTGDRFTDVPDHELYFRKSSEWAYEREWRLVESMLAVEGDVEDPKTHWPFTLATDAIKSVVIGHRAGGLFPRLHEVLREERYSHVQLQLAIPDLKTFRLKSLLPAEDSGTLFSQLRCEIFPSAYTSRCRDASSRQKDQRFSFQRSRTPSAEDALC